jgi:hypothetical protein
LLTGALELIVRGMPTQVEGDPRDEGRDSGRCYEQPPPECRTHEPGSITYMVRAYVQLTL